MLPFKQAQLRNVNVPSDNSEASLLLTSPLRPHVRVASTSYARSKERRRRKVHILIPPHPIQAQHQHLT